ncbi:MAG: site-2 protease family protein [Hyphomicrobiales bacterium]
MWGRTLRIARLAGFDIKVDASWVLIAGLIVWSLTTGYFAEAAPTVQPEWHVLMATLAMLGLFASLIFHELAHALMARQFGVGTTGITLFLFGGVAELEREPQTPVSEFKIAVVGPLASLFLAFLFWVATSIAEQHLRWAAGASVFSYLAVVNLALALFNMVPAFPLDGGRVFRAFLWSREKDLMKATRQAVMVSTVFSWLLIALGAMSFFAGQTVGGLWPILLGLFLLAASRGSLQTMETDVALAGRTVSDLMTSSAIVSTPDLSLESLVHEVFLANAISFAPVVEDGTLLGSIDTRTVRRIDRENWPTTTVEDVFESLSTDNSVAPDVAGHRLVEKMAKTGRRKFLVVDDGHLEGVVSLSDLTHFLAISKDLGASRTLAA